MLSAFVCQKVYHTTLARTAVPPVSGLPLPFQKAGLAERLSIFILVIID